MQKGAASTEHDRYVVLAEKQLHWAHKLLSSKGIQNLSYVKALEICAHHPHLVEALFKDKKLTALLDGKDISILCSKNQKVALRVLSDKEIVQKLNGVDLALIAEHVPETAKTIFESDALRIRLNGAQLAVVGSQDESVAKCILERPKMLELLEGKDLGVLTKPFPKLAQQLVDDGIFEKLRFNGIAHHFVLDGDDIVFFGQYHKKIALHILKTPHLRERLTGYTVHILGRQDEEVALKIFHDAEIMAKAGPLAWAQLGKNHPAFAKKLLLNNAYMQQMDGTSLVTMAENNPELAMFLFKQVFEFKNEAYVKKIKFPQVCLLAKYNGEIALKLLSSSRMKDKLPAGQLEIIGSKHAQAAVKMLEDPTLYKKLNGRNLAIIGFSSAEVLKRILKDKKALKKMVKSGSLPLLCRKYMFIIRKTLEKDSLQKVLSSEYKELLKHRMEIYENLRQLLQKLDEKAQEEVAEVPAGSAVTPLYKANRKKEAPKEKEGPKKNRLAYH